MQVISWEEDIQDHLPEWKVRYELEVSEWSALESEVIKRDSEQFHIGDRPSRKHGIIVF